MKKAVISFVTNLYAIQIALIYATKYNGSFIQKHFLSIFILLTLISIIIGINNIRIVLKEYKKNENQKSLNNIALGLKLSLIPFWTINIMFWVLIGMGFLVVPGLFILLPIVVFPVICLAVIYAYFILIVTSTYSVCNLFMLYKNNHITLSQFIWATILQFLFVIDIISYIYWYFKTRKSLKIDYDN